MNTPADEFATFVVRLSRISGGRLGGVVERVRTGEKARFHELDALGSVIAKMLAHRGHPKDDSRRRASGETHECEGDAGRSS